MSEIREMYNINTSTSFKSTVCTEVVANNICVGCGICVAVCSLQKLKIGFNEFGEYVVAKSF